MMGVDGCRLSCSGSSAVAEERINRCYSLCQQLFLAAGETRRKERPHRESIIGGIRKPFYSLVSESTVSVPLP